MDKATLTVGELRQNHEGNPAFFSLLRFVFYSTLSVFSFFFFFLLLLVAGRVGCIRVCADDPHNTLFGRKCCCGCR